MKRFLQLISLAFTLTLLTSVQINAQNNVVDDAIEFAVLKKLYDSLGGANWTTKTNWPTPGNWPSSATAAQMGTWYGITVTNGDVVKIALANKNLIGKIPSNIGDLQKLNSIDLNTNAGITGRIPTSITTLNLLTVIWFNSCNLSGTIPSGIFNLPVLANLNLAYNQLTGGIPSNVGSAPALATLTLTSNPLGGTIPTSIENLLNLQVLQLASNQLIGKIPPGIGSLKKLTTLVMNGNQLSGTIPSEIGNLIILTNLTLTGNQLSGSIPPELGKLTKLTTFTLGANQLTGSIPESLGNLVDVGYFYLNNNQLSGSIPASLGNLTKVGYLLLNNNNLSGSLPDMFTNMKSLGTLRLSFNKLSGSLPPSLTSCINLNELSITGNQFSGAIPASFAVFTKMAYFYIDQNKFSGEFPNIFSSWNALYSLQISSNQFSGSFPSSINTCTALGSISITDNSFSGAFPAVSALTKLTAINATNNKFISVPNDFLSLPLLVTFNFTNNELSAVPNFSTHLNKTNLTLTLYTNRLDISQLQPLIGNMKGLFYSPQKTINDIATITVNDGSPLVITARPTGGTSTTVTWEKQGTNGTFSTISNDQDSEPRTYTRTSAVTSDEGVYRWKMTSTVVTGLTLYSDPIQVKSPVRFALDNWAFQYKYDSRKRMTHKRVPGSADWVYMVYDDRDRLVMTQDANQRTVKQWTFTKYDVLNRPVMTGLYTHTADLSQEGMSALISKTNFYESFTGLPADAAQHGYTNTVFAAPNFTVANFSPLTVTYYDNYNFRSMWSGSYTYVNENLTETVSGITYTQPANEFQNVLGQVTGTKTKLMDGGSGVWLKSVNYYDDKYRIVQTLSDNIKGGIDLNSNLFDFTGKVLRTKTTHVKANVLWKDAVAVTLVDNNVTNSSASPGWGYSGVASIQQLNAGQDGWVEVTVGTGNAWVVGLSESNPDAQLSSINFGISVNNGLFTCENAATFSNCVSRGTVASGDVLRVGRVGSAIKYYKNGTLIATSSQTSTSALMVDISMYAPSHSLYNVVSSFSSQSQNVTRSFKYDHAGRLLSVNHSVNGATPVTLIKNEYNELGQLIDKSLHSTDQTNFKQSIDYRYNIRGWLTSINNSTLTPETGVNDDTNDLFGMNLAYNDDLGTGNTNTNPALDLRQYNGNISAIKWNNNLAKGTIKDRAYNFKYDALNRLQSATHKEDIANFWTASSAYHEDNLSYDINGNIKTLSRKGAGGASMDQLTYNYGEGDKRSNQLLYVGDGADASKGFIDGNKWNDDYSYDANGNMVIDKNKTIITSTGTAGITYNYLNLPDKVTKSNGDYIKYIYDATGKKLSQQVYNTSNVLLKKTDYTGEYYYENDTLKFINHEEGRILSPTLMQSVPSPQLFSNSDASSMANFSNSGTVTMTNETIGSETYLKVVSNQTGGNPGFITSAINVKPGKTYQYRLTGYAGTTSVYLNVQGLVWNTVFVTAGAANESTVFLDFTVPSNVTTVRLGALWSTGVIDQIMYINKVELYEKDASGGFMLTSTVPNGSPSEYQYHLKDHLGNVRTTFTTKDEVEDSKATLETANANLEGSQYLNYDGAKRINSFLFDHTNNTTDPSTVPQGTGQGNANEIAYGGYSARLSGTANERIGLARSLSVMPGDKISMEVFAKYYDPSQTNSPDLNALMSAVGGNGAGLNPYTIIDGAGYTLAAGTILPFINALTKPTTSETAPKAYLNWATFDRNFVQDIARSGYKRITTNGREDGTNKAHDWLKPDNIIEIAEPGYVYIWLSNENETPMEVYFDDFKVTQTKSPVISTQDYYPFGLTFNSYNRENSIQQNYLFNGGSELERGLDLGWYHTIFRDYDPAIGRFIQVDPLTDFFAGITPYSFAFDNPILYNDPDGLAPMWFLQLRANLKQAWYNVTGRGNQHAQIEGRHNGQRVQIGARTAGQRPTPNPRTEQVAKTYGKEEQKPDPVIPAPTFDLQPEPDSEPNPTPESTPDPIPSFRDKQIPPGSKINFSERIPFVIMTDRLVNPEVIKSQLGDLIKLLASNTGISVYIAGNVSLSGIQGNTNAALDQNVFMNGVRTSARNLMNARAKAIYDFLIGQGVSPKQMIYGTGNVRSGTNSISVSFELRNK